MGIVGFALRFRHTFYVIALMMLFLGGSAILTTPKDIFPNINIPVVTVIWQYTGLTPEEMEQRVTTYSEYITSSAVNDIRNIESQTLSGIAVEKVYFQPNVSIDLAISQIVSGSNSIRALLPAGIEPPIVIQYSASSVPVLQLSLSSDQLNEQQLYDYGLYQIRQALAPIPGITLPTGVMNSIPSPASLVPGTDDPGEYLNDDVPNQVPDRRAKDRGRRGAARLLGFGAVLVLAGTVGLGVWAKTSREADAAATLQARLDSVPSVRTMIAKSEDAPRTIELTGNLAAFDSATLFARSTGYIGVRNVDIGSKVHKGDVLAVIEAPDLDQQLAQAKAQLVQFEAAVTQAEANADLGHVTNQRTARLVAQGWNSLQQGDQDRLNSESLAAALAVAKANVVAQQAAVGRLEQLTGFERITAPFDGVVTSRLTDVGSLVTADSSSGTPLFSLSRTDVLRVQVFVPQALSFGIEDGDSATVTVSELPGRVFHGEIARNAQALSAGTRTLLIEVDVDNKDGVLAAGLYSVIHLAVRRPNPVITVPSQAVMFNQDGLKVAVFSEGKVELRKIELELDNGATVDVRAGLKAGDHVILNPPANITDGERVSQG